VKGILADNNVIGQVAYLVQLMQAKPWGEFWKELGLVLRRFDDVLHVNIPEPQLLVGQGKVHSSRGPRRQPGRRGRWEEVSEVA